MLHRIVKVVHDYVKSVCERKHISIDQDKFTVEIIVTSRLYNGEFVSVSNHIDIANGKPVTYSETVRNSSGAIIDFVAGASGNKKKAAQDELVASFPEAKAKLAAVEFGKDVVNAVKQAQEVSSELFQPIYKSSDNDINKYKYGFSPEITKLPHVYVPIDEPGMTLVSGPLPNLAAMYEAVILNDIRGLDTPETTVPGEAWRKAAEELQAIDDFRAATEPEVQPVKVKKSRAKKSEKVSNEPPTA
jgi:hypothetical protein